MSQQFYFTSDYEQTMSRNRYLAGGLIRNGFKIFKGLPDAENNQCIWFHGLSLNENHPIRSEYIEQMYRFKGSLAFFMNDDHDDFHWYKIPPELINHAKGFYKNHWKESTLPSDGHLLSRIGLVNPILKPLKCHQGKDLRQRKREIFFIGKPTGDLTLNIETNQRLKGVNLLKNSKLPFKGGIVSTDSFIPPSLVVPALYGKDYWNALTETGIVTALWGYSPITYRFWEGLANRCLVIAPDFSDYYFASAGLKKNVHYIPVNPDLSDLIPTCETILNNPDDYQEIANNGFNYFRNNLAFSGINFPQPLLTEITTTWKKLSLSNLSDSWSNRLTGQILKLRKRW